MPPAKSPSRSSTRRTAKSVKSSPAKSAKAKKPPVKAAKARSPAKKAAKASSPAKKAAKAKTPAAKSAKAKLPAAKSVKAKSPPLPAPKAGLPPATGEAKAKPKRYWVVRNSAIHGRGVFAARKIKKHKTIIEYRGERTTWKEANKRPASDPDNPYHTFLFGLDDGRVIDADVGGNEARWINHSCKPNCETEEDEKGRVFIKSLRKIAEGEELTYDYQLTYDGKMGKKMRAAYNCRCGAKRCRGTMLGKKG